MTLASNPLWARGRCGRQLLVRAWSAHGIAALALGTATGAVARARGDLFGLRAPSTPEQAMGLAMGIGMGMAPAMALTPRLAP